MSASCDIREDIIMRTIRVCEHMDPKRFRALYNALISGTKIEGSYVKQYAVSIKAGKLVCKFVLRDADEELSHSGS